MQCAKGIGVIGAMDVEIDLLRQVMREQGSCEEVQAGPYTFYRGTMEGTPIVVVQCQIGMVNAAACTQRLIDKFGVAAVVNTGVAGSLNADINIGDVVVATDAVNHYMDVGNLGYAPGQTPGLSTLSFPCDETLRQAALSAAAELQVTTWEGRVASSDLFVREDADKQRIVSQFGASCCEMEGAAIAQVCWLNQIPCAILRAISDKADGSAEVDYPTFEAAAAKTCANLTRLMIGSFSGFSM